MKILIIIIAVILVLFLIYLYLIMPRKFKRPNKSPFVGYHYAHRGLFNNDGPAPENSLPAITAAVTAGYGIEFDVQLTKDGIPVVFHDASLSRMCNVTGNIWEYTLSELKNFKLGVSNETIPTLYEVLTAVSGRVPLIIEYKFDSEDISICPVVNKLLLEYKGIYCIESFHPKVLLWYRNHRSDIMRGQLSMDFNKVEKYKGKLPYFFMTYLLINFITRPDFIAYNVLDESNLSRRACKRLGALSVAWTIKSKDQCNKAKKQFDLFIFDSCHL